MMSVIKKAVKKLTGMTTSISAQGAIISTQGTIPEELTNTQHMFLRWNAERQNIPLQESQKRYFASWSAIRGGHAGLDYRTFNVLSYDLLQVFVSDAEEDIYTAYDFYCLIHFLRFLSYPEPQWNTDDLIISHLINYSAVDIIDYGCGLAQSSRALATYLKQRGTATRLILVDIPTIRKDFLLWLGKQADFETTFLDCTPTSPMPNLPECDICFATEFFEHVYEPLRYFDHIHGALRQNGLLVTNVADHQKEFLHVSPNLRAVRERIQCLNYIEARPNQIFRKRANDGIPKELT